MCLYVAIIFTAESCGGVTELEDDNDDGDDCNSGSESSGKQDVIDESVAFDKPKFNKYLYQKSMRHCQVLQDEKYGTGLEQCLADFTSLDVLDEDNKFICQKCSTGT